MIETADEINNNSEDQNMYGNKFFDTFLFDIFGNIKIKVTLDSIQNVYQTLAEIREKIITELKLKRKESSKLINQIIPLRREIINERKLLLQ